MRRARAIIDAVLIAAAVACSAVVDWRTCAAACCVSCVARTVRRARVIIDAVLIAAAVAGGTVVYCSTCCS